MEINERTIIEKFIKLGDEEIKIVKNTRCANCCFFNICDMDDPHSSLIRSQDCAEIIGSDEIFERTGKKNV